MTRANRKPIALEDIAANTLRGDVRDFLLQWIRNLPKAWPQLGEAEQKNVAAAADKQAEALVRHVTNLVGSQGFRSFEVSVGDFQKKGNRLEAKFATPYSRENLIEMAEAGEAGPIMLALVSRDVFEGERAPAKVMKDQPDLMDGEGENAGEQADASGEQQEQVAAAVGEGNAVDPATGEVIEVQPEEGQRQGERLQLTYDAAGEGGPIIEHDDAGDSLAAAEQREALGLGGTGALTQAELDALTPEQKQNVERLEGIQALKPGQAEPINGGGEAGEGVGDGFDGQGHAATPGDAPKRRGRKTTEQRVADNARAVDAGRML